MHSADYTGGDPPTMSNAYVRFTDISKNPDTLISDTKEVIKEELPEKFQCLAGFI